MSYFLFRSSNTNTPFAIINEQTFDSTSASITFIGRRRVDYGEVQNQNFLWLLENFANASQPSNPITGQLWYDTATNYLRVYNGAEFVRVSNSFVGATAPISPTTGQFWYDTSVQKLKMRIGSQWVVIGPGEDPLPFSIVFGG